MNIMNLTPHAVILRLDSGYRLIPASGRTARLDTSQREDTSLEGIPIVTTSMGNVVGLPEPEPDTLYLVSSLVAQHVRRPDVVAPDTGPSAIRKDGQIVAVTRLQRFE